jgi:hypothetical protein
MQAAKTVQFRRKTVEIVVQSLICIAIAAVFVGAIQLLAICAWRRDPAFLRLLESPKFRMVKFLAVLALGAAVAISQSHRSVNLGRNFDALVDVIRGMLPRFLGSS